MNDRPPTASRALRAALHDPEEVGFTMNDGATVWLPFPPEEVAGLPDGLRYAHWDGSERLPGDPGEVRFLVGPSGPGAEQALGRVLRRSSRLEVLQLLSSGYDYVTPYLDSMPAGARLATARGVHGAATSEWAVTLLLALSRGLDTFMAQQAEGRWHGGVRPTLIGKRVLLVGYGAVGTGVEARLGGFGCEVVPVARTGRVTASGRVYAMGDLPELLPTADAVVLCAPLTEETRGMIGPWELALLKDGALVVNVARGELVDTDALVREVRAGRLRAALDVTDPEPLPAGHPLWSLPGVVVTPHTGAFTDAFRPMTLDFLGRQLRSYARGGELENVVMTARADRTGDRAA